MLVKDDAGKDINIGDNVILWDGRKCCRAMLIKETATSVGYKYYGWQSNIVIDYMYWMRKSGNPFKGMVKV